MLLNLGYSTNFTCDIYKEWGEKLAARTVYFLITNKNMQMTRLEKNKYLVSKRDKGRRSNYFCSKLLLPIFPFWFSILNNLLIMDSLIGIMKYFFSHFSKMFPIHTPWNYQSILWSSDVFREYKTGTFGKNRSNFLTHFSPLFLLYTPVDVIKHLVFYCFKGL